MVDKVDKGVEKETCTAASVGDEGGETCSEAEAEGERERVDGRVRLRSLNLGYRDFGDFDEGVDLSSGKDEDRGVSREGARVEDEIDSLSIVADCSEGLPVESSSSSYSSDSTTAPRECFVQAAAANSGFLLLVIVVVFDLTTFGTYSFSLLVVLEGLSALLLCQIFSSTKTDLPLTRVNAAPCSYVSTLGASNLLLIGSTLDPSSSLRLKQQISPTAESMTPG